MRSNGNVQPVRSASNSGSATLLSRGGSLVPGGNPPQTQSPLRLYTPPPAARSAFNAFRGESVVVIADDANLAISFREQAGSRLDYARLLGAFRTEARALDAHLVLTGITVEQHQRAEQLSNMGYHVHRIPHLNVDVSIGFVLGRLTTGTRDSRTLWVLATGDGDLGLCLAGALRADLKHPRIVTLSVRHSTALVLRQCPLIEQNIFLANDLAAG